MGAAWLRPLPRLNEKEGPKTVLVTGGTSGIGRATVEVLAAHGDTVFACGRNAAQLEELRRIPNVRAWQCDVADEASVEELFRSIEEALGGRPLDVLVNNAGVLRIGDPLLSMDTAAFEQPWLINVRGPFIITRRAWPLLSRSANPIVVNIGSSTEHPSFAQAFHTTYCMSKTALRAFSQGLRQELAVLMPKARVVHLKVGAHKSGLDHSPDSAAERLAVHGPPFVKYAPALRAHIAKAFGMVKWQPAHNVATAIRAIAHPTGGAAALAREYHLNVSFLERLVEWLPAWLLDRVVLSALTQ